MINICSPATECVHFHNFHSSVSFKINLILLFSFFDKKIECYFSPLKLGPLIYLKNVISFDANIKILTINTHNLVILRS
jgi:hypothetical protein